MDLYSRWFRYAAENPHLDGVDLMDRVQPFGFPDKKEEIREMRILLKKLELPVVIFTTHPDFRQYPLSGEEKDKMKFLVEEAAEFDALYLRVMTWTRSPGELLRPNILENVISGLQWAADLAGSAGLPLVIENHHETSDEIITLLEALKNLKLNLDIKSCFRYNLDPYLYTERLLPYASTFHLDNFVYDQEGWDSDRCGKKLKREIPLDKGEIDIRKILTMIKGSGFDGWLSIEYGGKVDNFDDVGISAEYVRKTWNSIV